MKNDYVWKRQERVVMKNRLILVRRKPRHTRETLFAGVRLHGNGVSVVQGVRPVAKGRVKSKEKNTPGVGSIKDWIPPR